MKSLPDDYLWTIEQIRQFASNIDGWLSPPEIEFLGLIAACPTTDGEILEIGCHMGKSTYVLAKAAKLVGENVVAVDPLPDDACKDRLKDNLNRGGVADNIEFHREKSWELARTWDRPLRVLWIDGDHSYENAKRDLDMFLPWLNDGAIVALHDVLHEFEGPLRVFSEDILLSCQFGAAGMCGSIGWAQFHKKPSQNNPYVPEKLQLYRKLMQLVPHVAFDGSPQGIGRIQYKFHRSMIPHGRISPNHWLQKVA